MLRKLADGHGVSHQLLRLFDIEMPLALTGSIGLLLPLVRVCLELCPNHGKVEEPIGDRHLRILSKCPRLIASVVVPGRLGSGYSRSRWRSGRDIPCQPCFLRFYWRIHGHSDARADKRESGCDTCARLRPHSSDLAEAK